MQVSSVLVLDASAKLMNYDVRKGFEDLGAINELIALPPTDRIKCSC